MIVLLLKKSSCDYKNVEIKLKRKIRKRKSSKQNVKQVDNNVSRANSDFVHFLDLDTSNNVRRPKNSGVIWKKKGSCNTFNVGFSAVSVSNLNKNVKRYSRKDLLACNISHLGKTTSASLCNDAMNVSCNPRMCDLLDDNNFFIFDDVNVRISPVSKMPFRKKPRDSMHVHSKSNMIISLPRTVHKWLLKMQPLAEPVSKWFPRIVQICLWIINLGCSKHMTGNRALLTNFVENFLGTVRFGNNDFAVIAGYGDEVIGSMTIKKVYYVEGLGHNLFSVGQFCDKGLEVAFRKSTCFVRNEDGVDLLIGDRASNLYTIALNEVASNSSKCLLAKASSLQSWLWHQRLSHLNFDTINNLVKKNLVQGLPKMKFEKDHLCSACEQGKIHRKYHKSKMAFASNKPLYLHHMDLCGPMRVQNNMSRDVLTVGSTMRIPLLYRGEYSQWVERFMNYLEKQTDGKAMINSIKNGDQPLSRVTQVSIPGTSSTEQPPLKDKSMWKAAVLYEYETFKANEGELLLDTYIRYLQVINDLKKCGYSKDNCELNFKFLNNLQPEWKQYAIMMRQNKNLMDINIDALYNILKQNQGDVNDAMGSKKKTVVVTSDHMALIAEKTKVSRSKKKAVVSSDSEGSEADDFSELKKITALLAKAFNRRKFYSKPTNNNLRTSSSSQSANKKQEFVKTNNKRVEKIIIDLEDEVINLLKKEKVNLETIESLKSKGVESSETVISESENQRENDCLVVEKECDKEENPKNVEIKLKRKRRKRKSSKQNVKQVDNDVSHANNDFVHFSDLDTFSSVRRPKNSGVIWKKKGSSNISNVGLSD
nr:retrovirus-related Pol polyprotein from transposon TNT 1-94 [Tanacetum cinerariifolium]